MTEDELIAQIPKRKIRSLLKDPEKSAEAVNLVYVSDCQPGISRVKKGSSFEYWYEGKQVKDEEDLLRIKRLVIPPAWEKVWICKHENGHLQVTGIDARGRKQYKYHPNWNILRNHTKFYRLYQFGLALPCMRVQMEKDLNLPGLPLEKVLATVVSLMERTNIRIGNEAYEKIYGSYGITTLKDKHVKISGHSLKFSFKGKKGVYHDIDIKSKRLASIVKKCQDIPGKELFQYIDEAGNRRSIDSGQVNDYIKSISGGDFTAKDFRTWSGTVQALLAFKSLGNSDTATATKKNIVSALDSVSQALGNTRTVCKKYYVHPIIISLYENNALDRYWKKLEEMQNDDGVAGLTAEEQLVMNILKNN
ncbi:DNA topoisomerase IB [Aridibaculum aurantiacum]|uniref:DNA topoisomerase IB n=1 Tax=Aridibaculum aurantiacum TaxID=2810307 RepID=UPI001A97887D|nr:DNA topoisomerase IB [Aridibaculum aurantiacum]